MVFTIHLVDMETQRVTETVCEQTDGVIALHIAATLAKGCGIKNPDLANTLCGDDESDQEGPAVLLYEDGVNIGVLIENLEIVPNEVAPCGSETI